MKLLSISELFNRTRAELFALHAENVAMLLATTPDAPAYATALTNLRRIRRVLAHRQYATG